MASCWVILEINVSAVAVFTWSQQHKEKNCPFVREEWMSPCNLLRKLFNLTKKLNLTHCLPPGINENVRKAALWLCFGVFCEVPSDDVRRISEWINRNELKWGILWNRTCGRTRLTASNTKQSNRKVKPFYWTGQTVPLWKEPTDCKILRTFYFKTATTFLTLRFQDFFF